MNFFQLLADSTAVGACIADDGDPKFNLWTFANLTPSKFVPAMDQPDSQLKVKKKNAFPAQLNPAIYTAIFALFVSQEEKKAAIHLNTNVCQSLAVFDSGDWTLHCWGPDETLATPEILHTAFNISNWTWNNNKAVIFFFIFY